MKYFFLTIKHKWFVFLAGIKIGVPIWQLITHDLSKFSRSELRQYNKQFFGEANDPHGYAYAWNHHQKANKHHFEYWTPISGHTMAGFKDFEPLRMPRKYVLEMVADWFGASRAYEGVWPWRKWLWFAKNWLGKDSIKSKLHPDTAAMVESIVGLYCDSFKKVKQMERDLETYRVLLDPFNSLGDKEEDA